jgi:hypothetical protein
MGGCCCRLRPYTSTAIDRRIGRRSTSDGARRPPPRFPAIRSRYGAAAWPVGCAPSQQSFVISQLATDVELSVAAVSRAVQALDEMALVRTATAAGDARGREVRLGRPIELLNAWLAVWQRRRVQRTTWDVGADTVESAIKLVASAASERDVDWALGGLAGAAEVARAVEPADAAVWIAPDDLAALAEVLMPERSRGGRGTLRVTAAPDPWTLALATARGKLPVADPVQLWLDCSSEGERALEAADAVAKVMGW